MYAIINIAGRQYKVEKGQKLFVHRLEGKEGDSMHFDEVLLIDNDNKILVGEPVLQGARIVGKVLSHPRADKIQVFKKKRRKGYQVHKGHRQNLTEIQIQDIIEKVADKSTKETTAKKTAGTQKKAPAGTRKAPAKKASGTRTEAKPAEKEVSAKQPAAKKSEATKKPASKITATKSSTQKPDGQKAADKKPASKKTGSGKESGKE